MNKLNELTQQLEQLTNPENAMNAARFFKTGKGEYGEGDLFRGIRVPVVRALIKPYTDMPLTEVTQLLHSAYHEDRLAALLIMVKKYQKGSELDQEQVYQTYLDHFNFINNWDLVDTSTYHIVGAYLLGRPRDILYQWIHSNDLWTRRIAMVSTLAFIRKGQLEDTFQLAELLLKDQHDLMHKAAGWMLREAGKKDQQKLVQFLDKHASLMPRTMLRYAIEKLDEPERKQWLSRRSLN